mgnify:CR=1 FL=1
MSQPRPLQSTNPYIDELLRPTRRAAFRNGVTATDVAVGVTAFLGTLGTVLISDDYDFIRYVTLGLVGMPLAVLYAAGRVLFPNWRLKSPRTLRTSSPRPRTASRSRRMRKRTSWPALARSAP